MKCNNCVAKVQQSLDAATELSSWSIDLKSPDRILSIEAENDNAALTAVRILTEAGYQAVELK